MTNQEQVSGEAVKDYGPSGRASEVETVEAEARVAVTGCDRD